MPRYRCTAALSLLVVLLAVNVSEASTTVSVDAVDSGWYDETGSHDGGNTNYLVGICGSADVCFGDDLDRHNFFVFDLSSVAGGPAIGATLRPFLPTPNGFISVDAAETYSVFDVSTAIPTLTGGGTGLVSIFTDLGSGTGYGSVSVSAADDGTNLSIPLNASGVAAANAALGGGMFAVGGAVTTLLPAIPMSEAVFAYSFGPLSDNKLVLELPLCGDSQIDAPVEQCDDGNVLNGDCCSSTCQYEPSGTSCTNPDSDPCTANTCDGAGTCGAMPTGCKAAGKSLLLLKNNADDSKDKLVWKWLKGAATTIGELGDPTGATDYTLCLYSGTGAAAIALPAGSNWQTLGTTGFKFKNPGGTPNGAQKGLVKSGSAGKTKALVKGKGTNLPDALAPTLALPVTVQLVNDTNSVCFEAVYSMMNVIKNDERQFKAKK